MPDEMSAKANAKIPDDQMNLPFTFTVVGKIITLQDYLLNKDAGLPLSSLTPEQRIELVSKRFAAKPKWNLATLNDGLIARERAIEEVKAQTSFGKELVELECRAVKFLMEYTK